MDDPSSGAKLGGDAALTVVRQGKAVLARKDGVQQSGVGAVQAALLALASDEEARTGSQSRLRVNLGPGDKHRGIFGAGTERAVIEFQRRVGLSPTGQVDDEVLAAMERELARAVKPEAPAPASPPAGAAEAITHPRFAEIPAFADVLAGRSILQAGDTGPAVRALQEVLTDMGFSMLVLQNDVGASGVDGTFGGQTETALRNFQVHAKRRFAAVRVNGLLDAATMEALLALAPARDKKAWDTDQPNHAPVPYWNGDPAKRLRVVVVKDEHRTFLFDREGRCTGIFPNAHGTAGSETDTGLKKIRTKLDEAGAKATGKRLWDTERAFGKRILDLCWASGKSHGEELHGTYDYRNMGKDVSHGCVRHYNEDIVTIYNSVSVDEYVAIVNSVDELLLHA